MSHNHYYYSRHINVGVWVSRWIGIHWDNSLFKVERRALQFLLDPIANKFYGPMSSQLAFWSYCYLATCLWKHHNAPHCRDDPWECARTRIFHLYYRVSDRVQAMAVLCTFLLMTDFTIFFDDIAKVFNGIRKGGLWFLFESSAIHWCAHASV